MTVIQLLAIAFVVSLVLVASIHARVVRFAVKHHIVDHPDYRKLQKTPVPVMGGVAVFLGMLAGLFAVACCTDLTQLWMVVAALFIMLSMGLWDDSADLSPYLRFAIEIAVVLGLILGGGFCIDDFHGLFGLRQIPAAGAIPLTIFAAVGIINAINLIDGVNGLSSGFGIMACCLFGAFFYVAGNVPMLLLAAVSAGALIPFFFHNVFGKTSRMFIGDSGSLVMGLVMAIFVCSVLRHDAGYAIAPRFGLIPFTLAVLSVPVFDTLRVMVSRKLRGESPFHPDKTHLHHIFIRLGCSHPMTTLAILSLDAGIVGCWWVAMRLGAPLGVQLLLVVVLALLATVGVYHFLAYHLYRDTQLIHWLRHVGHYTHLSRTRLFLVIQHYIDKM